MNSYESMVIIPASLQKDEVEKENEKITQFIKENGGTVKETVDWKKRSLAYEIGDQKEGYYFINYFELPANKIKELDRLYRLNENIIRYNIIKK